MQKKIFNIIKYIFFSLIGIFLLWLVTKDKNIETLLAYFKTANYSWILLSMVVGALSHFVRAIRWNILIKEAGSNPTLTSTFYAVMVGYLANLAIPRIGEITRCGILGRTKKISIPILIGTVFSERAFDMISLFFLLIITIAFQFQSLIFFIKKNVFISFGDKIDNPIYFLLLGLLVLALTLALFFLSYKYIFLPIIKKSKFFFKFKRILVNFIIGIKAILKNKKKWLFIVYTIILWLCYTLMVYFCIFALKETTSLSILDGFTIMVLSSFGVVAPVPGGIGAYHFITIALLTELYNIGAEAATSFAYITHTSQMLTIIIIGFFSYIMLLSIKNKKNE